MLVVKEDAPQARDRFLTATYAAILHNHPLSSVARDQPDVNVNLYLGRSADRSLSFDGLMKQLRDDLKRSRQRCRADRFFGFPSPVQGSGGNGDFNWPRFCSAVPAPAGYVLALAPDQRDRRLSLAQRWRLFLGPRGTTNSRA